MNQSRLAYWIFKCISIFMALGVLLFVYFQFRIYYELQENSVKDDLRKSSQIARSFLSPYVKETPPTPSVLGSQCQKIALMMDMRITVIRDDGVVIGDSLLGSNYRLSTIIEDSEFSQSYDSVTGQNILSLTIQLEPKVGNHIVFLRLAKNYQNNWESLKVFLSQSGLAILSFVCIMFLLSAIIAGYIDQSIKQFVIAMDDVSAGNSLVEIPRSNFLGFHRLGNSMKIMIDKLQKNQSDLNKVNTHWKLIFESMNEGIVVLDYLRNINIINNAAKRFWGLNPDEDYIGRQLLEVNRDHNLKSLVDSFADSKGINHSVDVELSDDGKSFKKYLVYGAKFSIEDDQPLGLLLVFADVTRIKELELSRQQFFDNVSHELKTPLTTIQGIVEALPECIQNNPKQTAKFVKMIENNAKRINGIIDDLFYLSKLDQGDQEIYKKFKVQNLNIAIEKAVASVSNTTAEKNIRVVKCIEHINVYGNHGLLEEAIRNILENAVKYSPEGSRINVSCTCNGDQLELSIEDFGIGMPPKDCHRIFERFYRVDKSRDRHTGGTGIGLAIVKHIIQIHQGDIIATSEEGEGSIFKISLPMSPNV